MNSIVITNTSDFELVQEIINRKKLNVIIDTEPVQAPDKTIRILGINLDMIDLKESLDSKAIKYINEL